MKPCAMSWELTYCTVEVDASEVLAVLVGDENEETSESISQCTPSFFGGVESVSAIVENLLRTRSPFVAQRSRASRFKSKLSNPVNNFNCSKVEATPPSAFCRS